MRDTGHNTRARTYVRADDSSLTGKRPSLVALPALTFSARNAGSAGCFCVSLLYYARVKDICGLSQKSAGPPENAVGPPENAAGPPENAAGPPEKSAGPPENAAGPPENQKTVNRRRCMEFPWLSHGRGWRRAVRGWLSAAPGRVSRGRWYRPSPAGAESRG